MPNTFSGRIEIVLEPPAEEQKQLPVEKCPACGSTWFQRCAVQQFSWNSPLRRRRQPAHTEACSRTEMALHVCLCGMVLPPRIGGWLTGIAVNRALQALVESVDQAAAYIAERQDNRPLAELAAAELWPKKMLEEVAAEARKLERQIGRRLARTDPKRKSPRGRHWSMPRRKPANGMRDQMVVALQQRGFKFREARQIVHAIFEAITDSLRWGETVETDFGVFAAVPAAAEQERLRRLPGDPRWAPPRRQRLFRNWMRIKFTPFWRL